MTIQQNEFFKLLENSDNFKLRRAVERLRDGLFDPFGVRLLTTHETQLNQAFDQGVQALEQNASPHLCVCGSYGQGKSHSLTYLGQRALDQGFVTSQINLDPREISFHDFRQVYRALISHIRFPGSDLSLVKWWKEWVGSQLQASEKSCNDPLAIIPESMPHFFKSVLTALVQENMTLPPRWKGMKKYTMYRPREFPWLLANALNGAVLPVHRLRHALKYRQVSFYKDASLVCKGWEPYFEAVCSFAAMFKTMGFKGWVLLFDEGESITQRSIIQRRKSYEILHRFFSPFSPHTGLYPIFAFTDDFFLQVQLEDYDRAKVCNEEEFPYFELNYGEAWRQLRVHRLHNLTGPEWEELSGRLIHLHARAYGWEPPATGTRQQMAAVVASTGGQDARLKLKALVNQLDLLSSRMYEFFPVTTS
ncbi:MAG: BREX system ATP-binding domain-containing protein [Pseudomonadota bacterium]|nr:BREX system ATP-binding domain-containing protein [Pseudomonadota bacterium]